MSEPAKDVAKNVDGPAGKPVASKAKRPRRVGPEWFAPLFWLAICGVLVFVRFRSFKYSDFVAFHTRSGDVQGLASHQGQVLLAVSTLSLGRERALTIDRDTVPAAAFEELYQLVYGSVPGRKEFLGFGFAVTQKGSLPGDATHMAFAVPHWFLWLLAGIPAFRGVWLLTRYYTRPRRGRCRNCGYDLRGTRGGLEGGPCPECGDEVGPRRHATGTRAAGRGGRAAANVGATLLLVAAAGYALHLSRPGVVFHPDYTPSQLRAGFGRPVGKVEWTGVPLEEALRRLSAASGTRIDVDWGEVTSLDVRSDAPVSVRLEKGVPLGAALRAVCANVAEQGPEFFADGEGIKIGRFPPRSDDPLSVRVHDVRSLLDRLPDGPLRDPEYEQTFQRMPKRRVALPFNAVPTVPTVPVQGRETLIRLLEARTPSHRNLSFFPDGTVQAGPGTANPIHERAGRLIVVQTEKGHWEVEKLLRDLTGALCGGSGCH